MIQLQWSEMLREKSQWQCREKWAQSEKTQTWEERQMRLGSRVSEQTRCEKELLPEFEDWVWQDERVNGWAQSVGEWRKSHDAAVWVELYCACGFIAMWNEVLIECYNKQVKTRAQTLMTERKWMSGLTVQLVLGKWGFGQVPHTVGSWAQLGGG